MEKILQVLRELEGVRGAFLFDSSGQILAHQSHSIYDKPLLEQVSQILVKALDSLQVQHNEWDCLTVHFAEGKLLLKNVSNYVLAVIADNTLNLSFANVAMRVADSKIRKLTEKGGELTSSAPLSLSPAMSDSGMNWSGPTSSGLSSSSLPVADEAASNYLTRCAKALAQSVGPMAKIFLKESVRKVCPNSAFSIKDVPQLLNELKKYFDDPNDFPKFKNSITK